MANILMIFLRGRWERTLRPEFRLHQHPHLCDHHDPSAREFQAPSISKSVNRTSPPSPIANMPITGPVKSTSVITRVSTTSMHSQWSSESRIKNPSDRSVYLIWH